MTTHSVPHWPSVLPSAKTLLELGAIPKHKDTFGLSPYDHTQAVVDTPKEAAALLKSR